MRFGSRKYLLLFLSAISLIAFVIFLWKAYPRQEVVSDERRTVELNILKLAVENLRGQIITINHEVEKMRGEMFADESIDSGFRQLKQISEWNRDVLAPRTKGTALPSDLARHYSTNVKRISRLVIDSLNSATNLAQLRKNDVKEQTLKHEELRERTIISLRVLSESQDDPTSSVQMKLCYLNFVTEMAFQIKHTYCSRRGDSINQYFPAVMSERATYEVGDTIELRLAASNYVALRPEQIHLFINDQPLFVEDDGTANFAQPALHPGEFKLTTRVEVINRWTGEVRVGEGSFIYVVR